jgi:2-dehydropantoate 2-reductase
MNVTVIGAGGLGGYYGGLLGAAGHQVTFVCRSAHLDAIRRQGGIRLRTTHGDIFGPGGAVESPGDGPSPDLILFTVKSFDTKSAAEPLRGTLSPQTVILSLQNGVDNEDVLAGLFGAGCILGGVVYVLATIESPGVVHQSAGPRRMLLGEWQGGMSDRVRRWEEQFKAAGINATASDDIIREKWIKFAFICASAGMTALTRLPIGEIRTCPPAWMMFRQILEEVVAVGQARGVQVGSDVVEAHLALSQRLEPDSTSSLFYDLTHGKRLEIEALHGTVVRYGREAGVPTPACWAVYAALSPQHQRASGRITGEANATPL